MFDLTEKLSIKKIQKQVVVNCTFYFQTAPCRTLIEESLHFAGMGGSACYPVNSENLIEKVASQDSPIVIIEAGDQVITVANNIRHQLHHQTQVILIGSDNSITTLRHLETLGFYYLLWPADKQDVTTLLNELQENVSNNTGIHQRRRAMRTGVIGLNGGVGCTLIAAELAYAIADDSQKQVILVDHACAGSNINIMVGKRDLPRRRIRDQGLAYQTPGASLDHMGAQSQLTRIDRLISYLGYELETHSGEEVREYCNQVLEQLARDVNFYIEDYSASVKFYPDPQWLCSLLDCAIIVVQPSLSSLNEVKRYLQLFRQINENLPNPARLIIILNCNQPGVAVNIKSVESFLQCTVDIVLPFYKHCEEQVTTGNRFFSSKSSLALPFTNLSRLILGKPLIRESLLSRLQALW